MTDRPLLELAERIQFSKLYEWSGDRDRKAAILRAADAVIETLMANLPPECDQEWQLDIWQDLRNYEAACERGGKR